jgi:hypothetical protein
MSTTKKPAKKISRTPAPAKKPAKKISRTPAPAKKPAKKPAAAPPAPAKKKRRAERAPADVRTLPLLPEVRAPWTPPASRLGRSTPEEVFRLYRLICDKLRGAPLTVRGLRRDPDCRTFGRPCIDLALDGVVYDGLAEWSTRRLWPSVKLRDRWIAEGRAAEVGPMPAEEQGEEHHQGEEVPAGAEEHHQGEEVPAGAEEHHQGEEVPAGAEEHHQGEEVPAGAEEHHQGEEVPAGAEEWPLGAYAGGELAPPDDAPPAGELPRLVEPRSVWRHPQERGGGGPARPELFSFALATEIGELRPFTVRIPRGLRAGMDALIAIRHAEGLAVSRFNRAETYADVTELALATFVEGEIARRRMADPAPPAPYLRGLRNLPPLSTWAEGSEACRLYEVGQRDAGRAK